MRKGHHIIGLKVIAEIGGVNLGVVQDLIFDHDANECVGLLMQEGGFLRGDTQVIPWEEIVSIGPDAIIVYSESSKCGATSAERIHAVLERDTVLSGTQILTEAGQDLGTFADVYVDESTGAVTGYEMSGGFVADTMSGKRFLPAQTDLHVGKDVILAPVETAAVVESQSENEPGGLKGAASSAGERIGEAYDATREKVSGAYSEIANASIEKQKEFVVGKTAGRDVFVPSIIVSADAATPSLETLLVAAGETITMQHAESAEAAGQLGALVVAAGGGVAGGAYESGKESVSGAVTGGQTRAEDAAIGKPAGREVLLPSGSTLVAPGQIITRGLMEQAKLVGKENEVIAAAGLGAASQGAQSAAATVQESAGGIWETVKQKAAELTGNAQDKKADLDEAAQQRRINNALGRPTTRVILALDDSVILNTGDIITHRAIDHAREAGVLDILLDSVFEGEPDITPEMMRVEGKGEAALEEQGETEPREPLSDGTARQL